MRRRRADGVRRNTMRFPGRGRKAAAVVAAAAFWACTPAPIGDLELVAHIEEFEDAIAGQPPDIVRQLMLEQVAIFKGRLVEVSSAVVASTYTRENPSHIYFGVNYEVEDHLFLSEIDPPLHEMLVNHRHWVSVAASYPTRQLSYELPIDQDTFARLERGQALSFTCRIAALIRGKSVYCVPTVLEPGG